MPEYWFKPKQRGYGTGLPISWKGWALMIAYGLSLFSVPHVLELIRGDDGTFLLRLAIITAISVPYLYVAWRKTEGGWRWRHHDDDDSEDK